MSTASSYGWFCTTCDGAWHQRGQRVMRLHWPARHHAVAAHLASVVAIVELVIRGLLIHDMRQAMHMRWP